MSSEPTSSIILFNTLQYHKKLKDSGLTDAQAEAITNANLEAFSQMLEIKELATRKDLHQLQSEIYRVVSRTAITTIGVLGTLQSLLHFFG